MASRDLADPEPSGSLGARERVIEALKSHFALGHLELDELERRLVVAEQATAASELARLVEDLPQLPRDAGPPTNPAPQKRAEIVALLGGSSRHGRWHPPQTLGVRVVLGGVELDFRDAVLPEGGTVVEVSCLLGGVEITVPPDMPVQVEGMGILGGFEDASRGGESGRGPRLVVRGVAVLGGVEVRARPPRLPRDRGRRERLPG